MSIDTGTALTPIQAAGVLMVSLRLCNQKLSYSRLGITLPGALDIECKVSLAAAAPCAKEGYSQPIWCRMLRLDRLVNGFLDY